MDGARRRRPRRGSPHTQLPRRLSSSADHALTVVRLPSLKDIDANEVRLLGSGWLEKKGGFIKNWKRRFFEVSPDGSVTYSSEPGPKGSLKGAFSASSAMLCCPENPADTDGKHNCITLKPKGGSRVYIMAADNAKTRKDFVRYFIAAGAVPDASAFDVAERATNMAGLPGLQGSSRVMSEVGTPAGRSPATKRMSAFATGLGKYMSPHGGHSTGHFAQEAEEDVKEALVDISRIRHQEKAQKGKEEQDDGIDVMSLTVETAMAQYWAAEWDDQTALLQIKESLQSELMMLDKENFASNGANDDPNKREAARERAKVAAVLNACGLVMDTLGQFRAALLMYDKSLTLKYDVYDEEHPTMAVTWNNMAVALDELGRYDEATTLFEMVLVLDRKTLGPGLEVSYDLDNMAQLFEKMGACDRALEIYERSFRLLQKLHQQQSSNDILQSIGNNYNNRALILIKLARYEEALDLHAKAGAAYRSVFGDQHYEVGNSLRNKGVVYCKQKRYTEAIQVLKEALEMHRSLRAQTNTAKAVDSSAPASDSTANKLDQPGVDAVKTTPEEKEKLDAPTTTRQVSAAHRLTCSLEEFMASDLTWLGLAVGMSLPGPAAMRRGLRHLHKALRLLSGFGPAHPRVAYVYFHMGLLYRNAATAGPTDAATEAKAQALAFEELAADPDIDPDYDVLEEEDVEEEDLLCAAETYVTASLQIRERRLGKRHPDTQETQKELAAIRSLIK